MDKGLELYKKFIDDLVEERECVYAYRFREKVTMPENTEELKAENHLVEKLNAEDRMTVSRLLQKARNSGIHDVLRYLNDEILLNNMKISVGGVELPVEPFGSTMYWDWVARIQGNVWPDEK